MFRQRDTRLARFLFTWLVSSVALGVAAWLVGQVSYDSYGALALAGLIFAIVNTFVKPVLVLLGLPFIILTLGIGLFLINMFLVWLTAAIVPGFDASGFWQIAKAAIVVWLVNVLLQGFWPERSRWGKTTVFYSRIG
ncbi:MAG TPA: phage holin family protein [Gaiellales bacterium]|nr:phage holin family protein [Gaiellales bacterium]